MLSFSHILDLIEYLIDLPIMQNATMPEFIRRNFIIVEK